MFDVSRWRRFLDARRRLREINRAEAALDVHLKRVGPLPAAADAPYVIADGMWRNPNHFFRVRLFVEALHRLGHRPRLLGVLRRRADWRERRSLERIGFGEFVYIEDDQDFQLDQFIGRAKEMFDRVRSHRDVLNLDLPDGIPAYTFYDTVLKLAAEPRPALEHPVWVRTLAELLRNQAIYRRELATRDVMAVALSHPWKNEWATLAWLGLQAGVSVFHLTGYCEAVRMRRFRSSADYATPVEHLPRAAFDRLPERVQQALALMGEHDLARRASGRSSDINVRHAFDPDKRIADRDAARMALSGQSERPVVVVYSHVWFDFPHTYAMRNFTDFRDWMEVTLSEIRTIDEVVWLLKPHPTENWYGGFKLAEIARDLPPHVRLLPTHTDSQTAVTAADAVVTVHGTIGLEAAAAGVPVILGDRSYFSDWGVAHLAADRSDYVRLLKSAGSLPRPAPSDRARAKACFALAFAEPPDEIGAMRISCDSSGVALFDEIAGRYGLAASERAREVRRIASFIDQSEVDSLAAYYLIAHAQCAGVEGGEKAGARVRPQFTSSADCLHVNP